MIIQDDSAGAGREAIKALLNVESDGAPPLFVADGPSPAMIEVCAGSEYFAIPYASLTEARLVGVRELRLSTPTRSIAVFGQGLLPLLVALCHHRLQRLRASEPSAREPDGMWIDRVQEILHSLDFIKARNLAWL